MTLQQNRKVEKNLQIGCIVLCYLNIVLNIALRDLMFVFPWTVALLGWINVLMMNNFYNKPIQDIWKGDHIQGKERII